MRLSSEIRLLRTVVENQAAIPQQNWIQQTQNLK
jgi:hypothetical protein